MELYFTDSIPKILLYDIEISYIEGWVWRPYGEDMTPRRIIKDWFVMSWAAKWLGEDKIMYASQSKKSKNEMRNDKGILKGLWKLVNSADIVITFNGKKFDQKKINTRFIINGMKPTITAKHIDVYKILKEKFGFTSNSMENVAKDLGLEPKYKHKNFDGDNMWTECLKGNQEAWAEMEIYNKQDVTLLEQIYNIIIPWDNSVNFNLYNDDTINTCKCGSTTFTRNGFKYLAKGKYQRYVCTKCGAESRSHKNLLSKKKIKSLTMKVTE